MRVVVDTSVWSLALRRKSQDLSPEQRACVMVLRDLIHRGHVVLPGVIRQEVLSGITSEDEFERLRDYLRDFDNEPAEIDDYEEAAKCRNRCVSRGVAASAVDMLVCGMAIRREASVFTTDQDFPRYTDHLPLRLATTEELQRALRREGDPEEQ